MGTNRYKNAARVLDKNPPPPGASACQPCGVHGMRLEHAYQAAAGGIARAYLTTTLPFMMGWVSQRMVYSPARSAGSTKASPCRVIADR